MSFLDIALACLARGWYVLPVPLNGKRPLAGLVPHGIKDATRDEDKVRHWWGTAKPSANVAIACGASGLGVLDCDKGNADEKQYHEWVEREGIPRTYTVRSGRRDTFGTHSYFSVPEEIPSGAWVRDGHSGELRSQGYYVLACGSIHGISLQPYSLFIDAPIVPLPEHLRAWKTERAFTLEGSGELDALREALDKHGIDYEDRGNKLCVPCPWADGHSMYSGPSEAVLFVKNGVYCFKCQHSSCAERSYSQYRIEAIK